METRKPLTPCQKELLEKSRAKGMTEDLLRSWSPDPNVYRNITYVTSESNPEEQQAVEDIFTRDHASAVEYLMNHQKMTPQQAIDEVSGITQGEARFLVIAYKHGVRGETLRKIDTEKCPIDSHEFHEAFSYLVNKKDYSAETAILELDNLTPFQVRLLHELYPYGLRAKHIHAVLGGDREKFADAFDNYGISEKFRKYFRSLFEKSLAGSNDLQQVLAASLEKCNRRMEEAHVSIFKIPYNRAVTFLQRNQGLFAKDLPEHFSAVHQQLFNFLKRKGYDLKEEMTELQQLDAVAAGLLLKYYKDGVRAHHVIALNHHDRDRLEPVVSLLVSAGQPPVEAMRLLAEMQPETALAMLHQSVNNDNNAVPKM